MRKVVAASLAVLALWTPRARAASAEPDLVPMTRPEKPKKAASAPKKAPAEAAPPVENSGHAEIEPSPRRVRLPENKIPIELDEMRKAIREGPPKRDILTLRTRVWYARSEVYTRYSIQIPREFIDPPTELFYGESEERVQRGKMLVYSAEVAPLNWFSIEGEYGVDRPRGDYKDRFWIHSPDSMVLTRTDTGAQWFSPEHEDDTVYDAHDSGKREWICGNVFFRIFEGKTNSSDEPEVQHALDIAFGGHRYRQDSHFTDRSRSLSTGKFYDPASPLAPLPGYDSTYKADWRGPHMGFRETVAVPWGFRFEGQVLFSPFMRYRAIGFTNGATVLRGTNQDFEDTANGSALHLRFGAGWRWKFVEVTGGYMRMSFNSHHGNRRYRLAGGGYEDQSLEFTTAEIAGFYAEASLRF